MLSAQWFSFPSRTVSRLALRALVLLCAFLTVLPVQAQEPGLSLRVADEIAPAGGLALVRIELTEPKPISGGRVRISSRTALEPVHTERAAAGPLGSVLAVGLLSHAGDVRGNASIAGGTATVEFSSPRSTFGTDLDLPLMVIAIAVDPQAAPGDSVTLEIDLQASQFFDTNGNAYPFEVKQGTFTVGGVSITRLLAPSSTPAPGSVLTLEGVGFLPGAEVAIEGAGVRRTTVLSSQRIEVSTESSFNLDSARIRLRNPNPNRAEDFFYAIPELRQLGGGTAPVLRFIPSAANLLAGTSADLEVHISPAPAAAGTVRITTSSSAVLQAPESVAVGAGQGSVRLRVFALSPGNAALTASLAGQSATLSIASNEGTVLRVPVLRNDTAVQLGLALTNRGAAASEIRLRGFSSSPEGAAGAVSVERFVTLGPRAQVARFLTQFDGRFEGFRGWIEVSSASRQIHAMFLNSPAELLAFAGASDPETTSLEFVFPQSRLSPGGDFEFALINNNFRSAQVQLTWRDAGTSVSRSLTVPAQGMAAGSPAVLFGLAGPFHDGYLRVRSSAGLSAYQQVAAPRLFWGQVPPPADQASATLFLPHFVAGGGWLTEITLINPAAAATEAAASLVDESGKLITGLGANPARITLAPGGQAVIQGADLFGIDGSRAIIGSLKIEAGRAILGSALIADPAGGRFACAVPLSGQLFSEAVFAHVASGDAGAIGYFTGLAFHNPSAAPAALQVEVFTPDGIRTARFSLSLPSGGRIARLLSEFAPATGTQIGGHIHVISSRPIQMLEIFGNDRLDFLTTVTASVIR